MKLRSGTTYDSLYTGEKAWLPVFDAGCIYTNKYTWQRHGTGTQLFSSGGKVAISGNCFYRDQIIGEGTCMMRDGSVYTGELFRDSFTGTGTRVFPDGTVLKGKWFRDRLHGFGELTWPCGFVNTGFWWHGKYYKTRDEWEEETIAALEKQAQEIREDEQE
jgi:hypothetical protein